MADVTDITPPLDTLDSQLDKLEDVLKPLLTDLNEVTSKLPLLDKAKLYVLATYTIEATLFSALALNGVDTKNHAVYKELARVRQYFAKITKVETPVAERENGLDKQAAIRFIKAGLADNKDISTKLAEQLAKERAKAALKAAKGDKKRPAEDAATAESSNPGSTEASGAEQQPAKKSKRSKQKERKTQALNQNIGV